MVDNRGIGTVVVVWRQATCKELKQPHVNYFSLDALFDYLTL